MIFYSGIFWLQILFVIVALLPILFLKVALSFFVIGDLHRLVTLLLVTTSSGAILLSSIGILLHYRAVSRTLKPLSQMVEVGKVAASVAHDVRSPLSGIRVAVDYFSSLPPNDQQFEDYLNILKLSTKRLERVSRDLLVRYQGADAEEGLFNPIRVLDALLEEHSMQPKLKQIRYVKNYEVQELFLKGSQVRFERMVVNLLNNSIEAMELRGEILIDVAFRSGALEISFKDTGPGISSQKLQKIQSSSYTEGKPEGYGIGLSFVREVMREFGGLLRLESILGQGTTMALWFPIQILNEDLELEVCERLSVLVIDREAPSASLWKSVLDRHGISCRVVSSLKEMREYGFSPLKNPVVVLNGSPASSISWEQLLPLRDLGWKMLYFAGDTPLDSTTRTSLKNAGIRYCLKPSSQLKIIKRPPCLPLLTGLSLSSDSCVLVVDRDPKIHSAWNEQKRLGNVGSVYGFFNLEQLVYAEDIPYPQIQVAMVGSHFENSRFSAEEVIQYLKKSQKIPFVVVTYDEIRGAPPSDSESPSHLWKSADHIVSNELLLNEATGEASSHSFQH